MDAKRWRKSWIELASHPLFGIVGAAATTLLAYLCAFVLATFYSLRLFAFDVSGRFILKSVGASIAGSIILLLWNPSRLPSIFAAILLFAALYLGMLFLMRGITVYEIKFFLRAFARGEAA